jgi:hypothetical protein
VPKRYGTAHEPAPHLREKQEQQPDLENIEENKPEGKKGSPMPEEETVDEEEEEEAPPPTTIPSSQSKPIVEATDTITPTPAPEPPKTGDPKPLETILHMPSPSDRKLPHLVTPRHVHRFDTYSLVKDLTTSGFSQPQSVTIMKAVRGILTDNMTLAHEGLISKSNVENETYLFRAACSELRTEIGSSRQGETERMRSERGQLQHEVDLLGQRLGQEMGFVKDELKGLFDDRKMAVRQEQRVKETRVCPILLFILTLPSHHSHAMNMLEQANVGLVARTQLQDHDQAHLGCAQRNRRTTVDTYATRGDDNWDMRLYARRLATILELSQPRGKEERGEETAAIQ